MPVHTRPHVPTRTRRRAALATAVVVALTLTTGACSSAGDSAATTTTSAAAAYCGAWEDFITAFEAYEQIDLLAGGTDSIRTYFDDLDAAGQALADAADAQLAPAVDDFTTALDDLATTVTSGDLPVDRRAEVRAAADDVDAAWNDLVAAFEGGCPDVTATTVAAPTTASSGG